MARGKLNKVRKEGSKKNNVKYIMDQVNTLKGPALGWWARSTSTSVEGYDSTNPYPLSAKVQQLLHYTLYKEIFHSPQSYDLSPPLTPFLAQNTNMRVEVSTFCRTELANT